MIEFTENHDHESILYEKFLSQGKTGVHLCPEWDYMAIHDDSPEFEACLCSKEMVYSK